MTPSRFQCLMLIATVSLIICTTPVDSQLSLRGQADELAVNEFDEQRRVLYRVHYSNGKSTRILREEPPVWCCTCENDCTSPEASPYCECTCSCDTHEFPETQERKPKGDDDSKGEQDDEYSSIKSSKGDDDEYSSKSSKGDKYKGSKTTKGDDDEATSEDEHPDDSSESSSSSISKGDDDGSGGDDDSKSTDDDEDDEDDESSESTKGDDDDETDGGDDSDSGKEPTKAPTTGGGDGPSPTKKPTKEPTSDEGSDQCQTASTDDASLSDRDVARVADDFVPESDGFITKITFYGTYVVSGTPIVGTPTPTDLFHVTYYKDDGHGLPGNVQGGPYIQFDEDTPLTLTVVGPEETDKRIADAATMFKYEGTHDRVAVTAGETYWIEIFNVSGNDSQWFWVHSLDGNLRAVADGPPLNGYDQEDIEEGYDLAFCLNVPFSSDGKEGGSSKDSQGKGKNALSAIV